MQLEMDNSNQSSGWSLLRAAGLFTGDMHLCRDWVKRQAVLVQLLDWTLRGVSQVIFISNPVSGLLITAGLVLHNPWLAVNGLLGTFVSTVSAILLGQNREAISMGVYGYNGTLVGILMSVFSAKGNWYWWLLLPNIFMAMMCPVVTSALCSITSKWDLPTFTLPFDILVSLHVGATGVDHPYFPQVDLRPSDHPLSPNASAESINISQLFLSVPLGVSQVYGCDGPWTAALILLAILLSSPTICFHAMCGSAIGVLTGFALAAPHKDIYCGLRGYNCALSCIATGGLFYVITWQSQLLTLMCGLFCGYMTTALLKLMSALALPICSLPFCLSTLIFLLISSEIQAICRLPLSVVSYPEKIRRYQRQLKASEKAERCQQSHGREEAELKENGEANVLKAEVRDSREFEISGVV